ncbi:MAG: hypothetical protein AAGE80_02165 [Pseudomonadota bacterium]
MSFMLPFLFITPAQSDTEDLPPTAEELKRFGLSVGQAYACTETAAQTDMREEAQVLFDVIIKDLGSNAAFTFAASAGYGAAMESASTDCPRLLDQWGATRVRFGLDEAVQ